MGTFHVFGTFFRHEVRGGSDIGHDILYDAVSLHPVMVKHLGIYIWVTLLSADPAASQAAYLVLSQAYRVGEAVFASI